MLIDRWVPGVAAARSYDRAWLRSDLVAGLVLAAILVPQGMAYAELAGLPAVTGLYTSIACLVGYAIFGPSRVLVLGPDSSVSPLIFAAITPLLVTNDPGSAIALAGMLALLVGLIEIALGLGKLGFVADLLSSEVQVGYMNGLAITIVVSQLPKLCGFSTDADGFGDELRAWVEHLDATQGAALAVGLGVLVVLLVLPRFVPKIPAVLVAVAGATIVSAVLDLSAHGVATVGTLPQGFPKPSMPWTSFSDVGPLFLAAIGIVLVSLTDTIATASAFAARRGDELQPNQEMIGIGAANVAAGFFQGFAVSTSGSRTAVAEQSGAKSQLTGIVGAGLVAILLLFLNSLLSDLPQSALAGVVIAAALSLMNLGALRKYARIRRSSLVLSLVATLGVVALGVLEGIVVAIFLAILLFFRRNWWPHGAVLGRTDDSEGWHSIDDLEGAVEEPGIVVYRWEAPLFFANAGTFRQQIRKLVRARQPRWIVLQCEAVTDIDVTAAEVLEQLDLELNRAGIHFAFVEMRSRLQDLVGRNGLYDTLDRDHFYPTLDAALATIRAEDAGTDDGT
ncbi:MAG TPA: SulP family inorganic anion transporter [Acidimicrobiia bacterium]